MQQVLPAANCEEDSFCEEMAPVTTDDELFDVGAELDGAETTTEERVSDLEVCMDEELTAGGPEFSISCGLSLCYPISVSLHLCHVCGKGVMAAGSSPPWYHSLVFDLKWWSKRQIFYFTVTEI